MECNLETDFLFEQAIDNLENRLTVMAEEREEEKTSLTEKLRQVFLKLKNHLQGFLKKSILSPWSVFFFRRFFGNFKQILSEILS